MAIEKNRIKTSIFLTLLMILTPFAAASTVTTFADGSSEVDIEFKDSFNSVNSSDGGFYVANDETVTSASVDVLSEPMIHSSESSAFDLVSYSWDSSINNGATSFDSLSKFDFEELDKSTESVSLKSELTATDFEKNGSEFDNQTTTFDLIGQPVGWDYGQIKDRELNEGPDLCASGDMCWGTNIYDDDYTDDADTGQDYDSHFFELTSPAFFLDPNLQDTYLRYSSWHQFHTKYNQQGDYYYDDCAYVQVEYSATGQFNGEEYSENLPVTLPLTNGVSNGQGLYLQATSSSSASNRISSECFGLEQNFFAFAGTSTSPTNLDGWASITSNLAPYLGNYVKIKFMLWNSDAPGNDAQLGSAGWYIDDFSIGEQYDSSGIMIINNIETQLNYTEASPNGLGMMYLDMFEPGDSQLKFAIKDSLTGNTVQTTTGVLLEDLTGPVIELWDLDVNSTPYIDLELTFQASPSGTSTPEFYGYSIGTGLGLTFNDFNVLRGLEIEQGDWNYIDDKGFDFRIESYQFLGGLATFEKPIYQLNITGIDQLCLVSAGLTSSSLDGQVPLFLGVENNLSLPVFDFVVTLSFSSDCSSSFIWLDLGFGHHLSDVRIDYASDGVDEWVFDQPAFGQLGRQNQFYLGESNQVSNINQFPSLNIAPGSVSATNGFFLLPKNSNIEYFDLRFESNNIFNVNQTAEAFSLELLVGSAYENVGIAANYQNFNLSDVENSPGKTAEKLQFLLSDPNVSVIKTDSSGIDWVRVGLKITQTDSNSGGKVDLTNLEVLYNNTFNIGSNLGFGEYIREYVATESQSQNTAQTYVPLTTSTSEGGKLSLVGLSVITQSGYDSTFSLQSDYQGLYSTGELYTFETTHEVDSSTGASLSVCKIKFKTQTESFSLGYDLSTGFFEEGDDNDYVALHPSSSVSPYGSNGGKKIIWKLIVNANWDDQNRLVILSETIADNNVVGMLSGVVLQPVGANAVENDIRINNFSLFNTAGVQQNLDEAYSNQVINLVGNISFEGLEIAPDPTLYNIIVEERGLEIDGGFTNITWTEIANRSGVIAGYFDWNVDLGLFASGSSTYRLKLSNYEGGDIVCPDSSLNLDSDCGIQFNLSIDILNPNLISFELYKRGHGIGDINSDDNWRELFDDSWAKPKLIQDFRFNVNDIPVGPDSAVLHLWVEYDHDSNSNGVADASEYIQIATTSVTQDTNTTFSGAFNDYANSGQKGRVSLWVECYDLAGNAVDGGGPGFDSDFATYVSMDLEYPGIKSLKIEDSFGVSMIEDIPSNPPAGVGKWNQTMFAGNEYNILIEAEDGNGWKDVEQIEVILAPQETNYDSKIVYYPRNQTVWTQSNMFNISTNSQGFPQATIRTLDGNVLLDPFEPDFIVTIPISFAWGLPLDIQYTPSFEIKDLDNTPVASDSSFKQSWWYENDMRLDFRVNLDEQEMISPTLVDQDTPISENLYHEIGQENFIGSVTGGDVVMFSGQYSFTSGILEDVFVNPEVELTMELTRKEVFRNAEKDYDSVDQEVTFHTFTGGKFNIPIKLPSYQNEFEYDFRLINLPIGAQDLTSSYCFGSIINGCSKFVIKVDDEAPDLVFGSWSASRGESSVLGLEQQLFDEMPTSTYHCVDITSQIEERGVLIEEETSLNWIYYEGDIEEGNIWSVYQNNYGTTHLFQPLNLSAGSLGYVRASADCVDFWPVGIGQFDVTESDLDVPLLDVTLVIWIETIDGAGSPIIGAGRIDSNGIASGIEGNKVTLEDSSTYDLVFEGTDFSIRNMRTIPNSPEVGDSLILEVELENLGIPGVANLEIKSVTENGIPVTEGYITSEVIGNMQAQWVSIELETFAEATTGMYYIVYDNETNEELFNGKDEGKAFNVKASGSGESGFSPGLIFIILIAVIAILVVAVVVISRRNNDVDFDDLYDDEDDKSYASIPPSQTYSAPATQVSPEMAEAMEKFTFWTQEEIQGYFDQGWNIQQLEEWLESQ